MKKILNIARIFIFFFFFSSRRRHTRLVSDWSQTCALPISRARPPPPGRWPTTGWSSAARRSKASRGQWRSGSGCPSRERPRPTPAGWAPSSRTWEIGRGAGGGRGEISGGAGYFKKKKKKIVVKNVSEKISRDIKYWNLCQRIRLVSGYQSEVLRIQCKM